LSFPSNENSVSPGMRALALIGAGAAADEGTALAFDALEDAPHPVRAERLTTRIETDAKTMRFMTLAPGMRFKCARNVKVQQWCHVSTHWSIRVTIWIYTIPVCEEDYASSEVSENLRVC